MKCSAHFDMKKDLKEVDQNGWIDLASANALSSIPANISNLELSFNGIDDPRSIGLRPGDVFEAAQASCVIAGYKAPENESQE